MSRDQIADLVHRYADAVVHDNGDQWRATWAPDGRWTLGGNRPIEGRDAIVTFWHQAMGGFEAVVQTVLNGSCELDSAAGTGTGRWYVQEAYRRADGLSGMLLAHYDDVYRHLDGAWCFAERSLTIHYNGPVDLSGEFQPSG